MLENAALVAFVAVTDLDRAERFYGGVLWLPLRGERPYALVAFVGGDADPDTQVGGSGTQLRITAVDVLAPAPYTVLGWTVADLDTVVDTLSSRSVTFTRCPGMGQDARGIWTAPSGARVAWFTDPDGNTLSLTQPPPG